jgi:hydrogenase/urease accessory protein HupE
MTINAGLGIALVLLCASSVRAHELGTTRVSVLLRHDRSYAIEIVTDAAALVAKLEAAGGRPPGVDNDPARQQALLRAFDDVFRRRLKIAFDGSPARPAIDYSVSPPADGTSSAVATVRLAGDTPPGARCLTWSYGWTFASYALTVRREGSEHQATEWLEGGDSSAPVAVTEDAPAPERRETARRYLVLGFTHIMPRGLDHVLFVLGIYLLSGRARSVLWQVSAFTIAHSITLGLSLYGVVTAPAAIIEPMIALSIAYVAIENVFLSELRPWRLALVFAFGLLHGLGFAGALKELGLPRSEFLTALVTFNVGVEAGQLTVIAAAFLLVGWHCRAHDWYRSRVVIPASLAIACTAIYWTVQRLSF